VPGRLIALEGIDGSGKSTQARLLASRLPSATVTLTAEPGGTDVGATLRRLLLDPRQVALTERTEALLLAADRSQHVAEVLRPALAEGRWVVTDRFSGSTLAYQGYGRGLDLDRLDRLVAWAADGLTADLNVLVDVAVDEAFARRQTARRQGDGGDRLERMGAAFQEKVRAGYLSLADADGDHWAVVDGTGGVDEVAASVLGAVIERLGPLPTLPS
jgi:dTMP kinase